MAAKGAVERAHSVEQSGQRQDRLMSDRHIQRAAQAAADQIHPGAAKAALEETRQEAAKTAAGQICSEADSLLYKRHNLLLLMLPLLLLYNCY